MRRPDPGVASTLWSFLKRFFSRSPSTSAPSSLTSGAPKESQARDGSETKMSNPWYEVVGPEVRLTQGDIILECPLLKWQLDDAAEGGEHRGCRKGFPARRPLSVPFPTHTGPYECGYQDNRRGRGCRRRGGRVSHARQAVGEGGYGSGQRRRV